MAHKPRKENHDDEGHEEFVPQEVLDGIEDFVEGRVSSKEDIASVLKF
ncbi:hypothetical protein KU306_15050 [Haloferax larsenii]|uniref:Uncharacterized protein n=1 Tax=Haloferax larsenii TaxID=302484 RepID=A0ABY5RDT1_HALLR|nr:hypothetical protein [Haloferax larsenii]UVE50200.1 hypothetical protein KU306_15050 [Haloferax larsenii]